MTAGKDLLLKKIMKKIKIKRATICGLDDTEGELFVLNNRQFCFTKCEGFYYMIDLETGCSVKSLRSDLYTRKQAIQISKEVIQRHSESDFDKAIKRVKKEYTKRYNFRLPVNQPIK